MRMLEYPWPAGLAYDRGSYLLMRVTRMFYTQLQSRKGKGGPQLVIYQVITTAGNPTLIITANVPTSASAPMYPTRWRKMKDKVYTVELKTLHWMEVIPLVLCKYKEINIGKKSYETRKWLKCPKQWILNIHHQKSYHFLEPTLSINNKSQPILSLGIMQMQKVSSRKSQFVLLNKEMTQKRIQPSTEF